MGSKSNGKCPWRKETEDEKTQKTESIMTMEGEIGVMWPQAKECLTSAEAGTFRVLFLPETFKGSTALLAPWFRSQASKTVTE